MNEELKTNDMIMGRPLLKVCTKCNIEKEVALYNKIVKGLYGTKSLCKACEAAASNARRIRLKATDPKYAKRCAKSVHRCREKKQEMDPDSKKIENARTNSYHKKPKNTDQSLL